MQKVIDYEEVYENNDVAKKFVESLNADSNDFLG